MENLGTVPFSELAMHCKIAGKIINGFSLIGEHCAEVYVQGEVSPVRGLINEVLSWEIRDKLSKC